MKRFLLALLLATSPLLVRAESEKDTMMQAVRAYNGGDLETARTLFQVVLETNPKNTAAQNYLRTIKAQGRDGSSVAAALKKVTLPQVNFNNTSIREAITYISQQVSKQTAGKQAVNIVWMVPEGQDKTVTLSLQNVPAYEALRYVADAAGLQLEYDNFAVKVKPAEPKTASAEPAQPTQ